MRVEYDEAVDAAYIYVVETTAQVHKTVPVDPREINGEISLDFDLDGRLVGIEIQNARRFLPVSLLSLKRGDE